MSQNLNIVAQISAGNEKVFEELFRNHYAGLCGYATKYVREMEQAEEIVQDLFFNLWNKRDVLEITISIEAYLFRSVRNSCLNFIKHNKVRENYASQYKDAHDSLAHHSNNPVEVLELQANIEGAIDLLPPERKKVFVLSRIEGKKYKEIADDLGISVKTVEAQMGKALKFLREHLSDYLVLLVVLLIEVYIFYLTA